jgi:hypothetical protein
MDEKTLISLTLAKSFIDQGHEGIAKSIIHKLLIDNGLDESQEDVIDSNPKEV